MNKMNKMNKIKRFLVALTVAALFGTSFVSCIDNEVSPEIIKIYQGHAELLKSQALVEQAEARLRDAEAGLRAAEASLREAEARGEDAEAVRLTAEAAKLTAETEKAKADLLMSQENHSFELKKAGLEEVDKLFSKYVTYRGLAEGKLADLQTVKAALDWQANSLIEGKFDSLTNDLTLSVMEFAQAKAEIILGAAEASLDGRSSSTQEAKLEGLATAYEDSLGQVEVAIKLKELTEELKQNEFNNTTGDSLLRARYNALVLIRDGDSAKHKESSASKKTKARQILKYDSVITALGAKITSAKAKHATAKTKRTAYINLIYLTDSNSVKLRDSLADMNVFIITPVADTAAARVTRDNALKAYTKAVADDARNSGLDTNPGADKVLGNIGNTSKHKGTNSANTTTAVWDKTDTVSDPVDVTYRLIKSVAAAIPARTSFIGVKIPIVPRKITFYTEAEFASVYNSNDFPEDPSSTATPKPKFTEVAYTNGMTTTAYLDAAFAAGAGKLFNVEYDDVRETVSNLVKLTNATNALTDARQALALGIKRLEEYSAKLIKYKAETVRLRALQLDSGLAATTTAYTNALKAIGLSGLATTTASDIDAKKTTAVNKATAAKAAFPSASELAIDVKLLNLEIATLVAKLADVNNSITALEAEIDSASGTGTEGVGGLLAELNAIKSGIRELEKKKMYYTSQKNGYRDASTLNNLGIAALEAAVKSAKGVLYGTETVAAVPAVPAVAGTAVAAMPAVPAVPAVLAVPAVPAVVGTPGTPAIPAIPGTPAIPAVPAVPAVVGTPGTPAIPAIPAIPASNGLIKDILEVKEMIAKGEYNKESTIRLIALLEVQIAGINAEVVTYLGIAENFKALAAAALALVATP